MKKPYEKNHRFSCIGGIILPLCIIISACFVAKPIARNFGKVTLALAGSVVPEGSVSMIKSQFSDTRVTKVSAVTPVSQKSTTKKEDNSKTKQKKSEVTAYNQSQTASDIKKIIEEAKKTQANASKSGTILEKNYHKLGANNKYDNVYVKNVTESHSINIKEMLSRKADLAINDKSKPTVLIYHSHTTEAYEMLDRGWYCNDFVTRSKHPGKSVVRVGLAIKQRLEAAGFVVLHDTVIHDFSYRGSYPHSRKSIEKYKKKYPTLKAIIDVHRDGMKTSENVKLKPTAKINGKKAAQVMIIAGCQDGRVKDFPDWEQNLVFATQLQHKAETLYPGIMRPIYFSPRKYNMDTSHCGVLLEMGSDANTLEEAVYSGELIGNALASLMNDYVS